MDALTIGRFNLILTCIKNIESFDGNDPNQLPDFISQIENIVPSLVEFDSNNKNIIFGYIKNKCVGRTREAIHRYSNVNDLPVLKEILVKNFGEKETSNDLMDNLKTYRLRGTIEEYFFEINKLANKIHNRNLTHGDKTYTTEEVNRISLKTFREHLPEPTRTLIFARNPNNLEDAYKIILDARHQNYTQFGPPRNGSFNTVKRNFSNDYKNTKPFIRNEKDNFQRMYRNQNETFFRNNDSYNSLRESNNAPFGNQQQFQANCSRFNRNMYHNSNNSNRTRQTNYTQNENRKYNYNTNDQTWNQAAPSGSRHTQNTQNFSRPISQIEPMEIGSSSVNFPNAVEQNYPT